jgi:hypothetical protein
MTGLCGGAAFLWMNPMELLEFRIFGWVMVADGNKVEL